MVSCAVAEEKKPQEITELEAITKEGDDDETTQRSVVIAVKTAGQESVQGHVACQMDPREKSIRRLVPRQREKKISESSLPKKTILEYRLQMYEQLQFQKIKRSSGKHDDPDKRGVPKLRTISSRC